MAAAWASPAGMVRRNSQQHAAVPRDLVAKLPPEFTPTLIEDGAIEAGFLAHFLARLFAVPLEDLDKFRTCKSSMQTSAWFWLIVVVVLCRKSLRALAMRV